jgi:hypothetical protein
VQVPADGLIAAREDVSALKNFCSAADEALAITLSYHLAEQPVQLCYLYLQLLA